MGAGGTYGQAATSNPTLQAAFGALFFAAAFPSGLLWLALGAPLRRALHDERTARVFNALMVLTLAVSVAMILR